MGILHNPYKDDYDHRPDVDKKGRFKDTFFYKGNLYILPFEEEEKKKTHLPCLSFGILMVVSIILQGLINQTSSRTIWIVLPYMIQFLPALIYIVGTVEYMGATPRMTREQYDKGISRMRFCAISLIVIAICSILCDIVYMSTRAGEYELKLEILYLVCHLATIAICLLFGRYYNKKFSNIEIQK